MRDHYVRGKDLMERGKRPLRPRKGIRNVLQHSFVLFSTRFILYALHFWTVNSMLSGFFFLVTSVALWALRFLGRSFHPSLRSSFPSFRSSSPFPYTLKPFFVVGSYFTANKGNTIKTSLLDAAKLFRTQQ